MPHDVFISHSSKDKVTADAVCAALEADGVRCWVAPRNILPGSTWATSIIRAIAESRMMVLIFSSSAQSSHHIHREVERAVHHGIPIAPIKIDETMPREDMEYFLSSSHWMETRPPVTAGQLRLLSEQVKTLLGLTSCRTQESPHPMLPPAAPHASRPPAFAPTIIAAPPTIVPIDSATLAKAEVMLTRLLGPIAKHLVKNAAAHATSPQEFYGAMARSIPSAEERDAFLQAFAKPSAPPTAAAPAPPPQVAPATAPPPAWDANLLKRVRDDLARYVGPMAKVMVTRAADKARSKAELRDLLAAEIPAQDEREAFRRSATWSS